MLTLSSGQIDAWLAAYLWPFLRLLALFSAAPLLQNRSVPMRVRIGLAMVVTVVVVPGLPPVPPGIDPAWLFFQQLAVGLGIGFGLQLMFAAFAVAGELLGLQMGLSFAAFVDPQNSTPVPIVGSFLNLIATLIFLSINGHLLMVAGIAESFHSIPVGAASPGAADLHGLVLLGSDMFSTGLQLALPVLATMLIVNLALGVLARTAPQLNIFAVGFPATVLIGMAALALVMPLLGGFFETALQRGLAAAFALGR